MTVLFQTLNIGQPDRAVETTLQPAGTRRVIVSLCYGQSSTVSIRAPYSSCMYLQNEPWHARLSHSGYILHSPLPARPLVNPVAAVASCDPDIYTDMHARYGVVGLGDAL
ncbi:hypothetical protein BD289DRAFT_434550 [Coniella lustricola]|uniref:Uncharacterized protein n=1 Tax=Coniella lustricola TaxID=2025994 RepID=A0A2T3A776_9PEZI|nr:hypothetical protein BD289DRAFT_434550 [Coniella lustricola]